MLRTLAPPTGNIHPPLGPSVVGMKRAVDESSVAEEEVRESVRVEVNELDVLDLAGQ